MFPSVNLLDHIHIIEGLKPTTPSTSTPDYISLKNAESVLVVVYAVNATTVTGSAITLKQATAVAGTSEKALAFTDYYAKTDVVASDAPWTRTVAASNTFTTNATNSKNSLYVIPVDPASLDINNSFDCLRAGTGDGTATTITVLYIVVPKNGGNPALVSSFIVD